MMKKLTVVLAIMVVFAVAVSAQRTVTGTVTDGADPLVGVTVTLKGSAIGTVTDGAGQFSIEVPEATKELVCSYTGYETLTINIEGRAVVQVEMKGGIVMDEVIVIGYGSKKRSELVGSSVQIKSDELEQIPVASVDQILQGKVAGLIISGVSGTPGSVQDIWIRGISSMTSGSYPLYVIDGVPMSNPNFAGGTFSSLSGLASLNPNDIASVTVLKDASATAVYGARGSNGVIVITTKRGNNNKTTINLSTSYGISNDAIDGPRVLTAAQRETLFYEALYNTYGQSAGFDLAGAKAYYEANPATFGTAYTDWNAAGRPEADWAKVITNKNAPQQEVNLSASGGDARQNFYASLGYYNAEATVIGADYRRISGSLKYARALSDKIWFDTKNTVANNLQNGILETSSYFASPRAVKYSMSPLAQPYNADGSINIEDIGKYSIFYNPLWIAANDIKLDKLTRFISTNSLSWETPVPNLRYTARVNLDYSVENYKLFFNRVHGDGASLEGLAEGEAFWITNYVIQNALDYSFSINQLHHVDVKVLQEFQKNKTYYLDAGASGFATDGLTNLASASTPLWSSSSFTDWAVASYTGMLDYDFNDKYIVSATYRREGNSVFSPENRWGSFWSVGAAWNMHKEAFFHSISIVDNLKLRLSYGRTGNANIGINQYQALFSFGGAYGGEGTITPGTFGNPLLAWETADNFETGMDFGLFRNRISGSFSYFRRETKNNLFNVPLSQTTGFGSQLRNIGRMENKGVELELNVEVLRMKDFNLSIGGNLATVHNKVLELPKDGTGKEINPTGSYKRTETGHILAEWYMKKWAGVDPQTGNNLYYLNGKDGETTDNVNAAQQAFIGKSSLPTLTAGMNLHLDFKGIFIDVYGYYAGGHMVNTIIYGSNRVAFDLFNSLDVLMNRWQKPGDITDIAKMEYNFKSVGTTSQFLKKGDFFRLRNVTLGYTLPAVLTRKVKADDAKIFVRGINLLTWKKDAGLLVDPEIPVWFNGFQLNTPPVKTLMVGLNFKF